MNTNFVALAVTAALATVAIASPASAQTARIVVAGTFASAGDPQYRPQAPPPRGYPQYPGRGGYDRGNYAFANGYRDGYDKGHDDARDRDRYDLRRHRKYRDGESGYDRDFGMRRDVYRDVYRRGFANGYEDGYRAGQRGYYGRGPRDQRPRGGFWFGWRF